MQIRASTPSWQLTWLCLVFSSALNMLCCDNDGPQCVFTYCEHLNELRLMYLPFAYWHIFPDDSKESVSSDKPIEGKSVCGTRSTKHLNDIIIHHHHLNFSKYKNKHLGFNHPSKFDVNNFSLGVISLSITLLHSHQNCFAKTFG